MTFTEKVETEYYDKLPVTTPYAQVQFRDDAAEFAVESGVPQQYVRNVVNKAWADGHSHGYLEVLNCLYSLIEIFDAAGKGKGKP